MQIFASPMTAAAGARAMDAGSSNGSTSAENPNAASVSANDFLQLLVTELKNQDPTANTDPNEYINQLVQVNSLEQLIQINQDLTANSTAAAGANRTLPDAEEMKSSLTGNDGAGTAPAGGNLSAPAGAGSASRIASAMESPPSSSSGSPVRALNIVRAGAQQSSRSLSNPAH